MNFMCERSEERDIRVEQARKAGNRRIQHWLDTDDTKSKTVAWGNWRDDVKNRISGPKPRIVLAPDLLVEASSLPSKEVVILKNGDLHHWTGEQVGILLVMA